MARARRCSRSLVSLAILLLVPTIARAQLSDAGIADGTSVDSNSNGGACLAYQP